MTPYRKPRLVLRPFRPVPRYSTSTFAAGDLNYISKLNELANASFTLSIQTVSFTASKGFIYALKNNAVTVTLPPTPAAGDRLRLFSASSSVTSVTLGRNGSNIDSVGSDLTLSGAESQCNLECVFVDSTIGWRVIKETTPAPAPGTPYLTWNSVQTGNFNVTKTNIYGIQGSGIVATLPATPTAGDNFQLKAVDVTSTNLTIGRNGSNINSVAADKVFSTPFQWDIYGTYINVTVGWLLTIMPTQELGVFYDATNHELKYPNTQRNLSAPVGWMPAAYTLGFAYSDAPISLAATLAVSGGAIAFPIEVTGHMLVESFTIVCNDTSGVHAAEWRVYKQRLNNGNAGENTLNEVPNLNGTFAFTPGAAGAFVSASAAVVYLPPGLYWVVLRNTSGAVTFGVRGIGTTATTSTKTMQTQTLGAGLGATLDFVTGWTVAGTILPIGKFNGRIFGQTSASYA